MKKSKAIIEKILRPPLWVTIILPVAAFSGLIYVFAADKRESAAAYVIFALSAYSLVILSINLPRAIKKIRQKKKDIISGKAQTNVFLKNYLTDAEFKGGISLYRGALVDLIYTVFRLITGILYSSVWFISIAVYHMFLGVMRAFLIICRRKERKNSLGEDYERKCYSKIAWGLLALNIPMSGMVILTVAGNSGYTYPGYVIYVSAMYTFYMAIMSVVNIVKYKKVGSPILSAAKVINFIAAMMSVLGLQTAMIAAFSPENETFRKTMNTITGAVVCGTVIITTIAMSVKQYGRKDNEQTEQ